MFNKLLSAFVLVSCVVARVEGAAASRTTSGDAAAPSGGPQTPPCVQSCVAQGGIDRLCDPADSACLCDKAFPDITTCINNSCSADDQAAANAFTQQMCNLPLPPQTSLPPTPPIPQCIQGCIASGGTDVGCDPSELECLCETSFSASTSCVFNTCSQADQITAEILSELMCNRAFPFFRNTPSSAAAPTASAAPTPAAPTTQNPPCVQACIDQGGMDRLCDPTDSACLCDKAFPDITSCINNSCSSDDKTAANAFTQQMCNVPLPPQPSQPATPPIPDCIQGCIASGGTDVGCDPAELECLCETSFVASTSCVFNTCSQADHITAEILSELLCNRAFPFFRNSPETVAPGPIPSNASAAPATQSGY